MLKTMSWQQARNALLQAAGTAGSETVALEQCGGRVLAADLTAGRMYLRLTALPMTAMP